MGTAPEPPYRQRVLSAARSGALSRLGGRWGAYRLVIPGVSAVVGFVVSGVGTAVIAAVLGVLAWLLFVGVVSLIEAPGAVDQITREQRDAARRERDGALAALDRRAEIAGALDEFRLRLDDGNELARSIGRWPRIVGSGPNRVAIRQSEGEQYAARREEYIGAVRTWNAACLATVRAYLPHRAPFMDRPINRADVPRAQDRILFQLREEVRQKIDWMIELQAELQAGRR